MTEKIIICIPINLNRQEIASALANKYGTDYIFIDRILRSTVSNESCQIDICDPEAYLEGYRQKTGWHLTQPQLQNDSNGSNLVDAFKIAGQGKLSELTLQQIDSCPQVVYLTSTDTGYDSCLQMARFAGVLLNIGGIAVKVESAGISSDRNKWLANYNSDDPFEIYSLFVLLIEGDDFYYSCGMHNFAKADVAIELSENIGLAIYVMNVFNYYRLTETPILQDNHTFQPDIQSPKYRIKWMRDNESQISTPLYNPFGRWHLFRI